VHHNTRRENTTAKDGYGRNSPENIVADRWIIKTKKMNKCLIMFLVLFHQSLFAQPLTKIIDMHIHSYSYSDFGESELEKDKNGIKVSAAETHRLETMAYFEKFNIVKAMVSGNPESVESWAANDKGQRIIRGIVLYTPDDYGIDSINFEQMVKDGKIDVFGEIAPYYEGNTLSEVMWRPYLRICEKYDIPVAVHTGGGPPGGTYTGSPKARLVLGDPYLIEDVLVNFPKLRIYIMHAGGEDWPEHAIRLMAFYHQLYTDLAAMLWIEPNMQRYIREFLRNIKEAGYLNRVMFGSDQMTWPPAIGKSIDFLNSIDFLTAQEKEDIFYNNAARFLRLKE
jgi:predicted TIM-barrel fold metal-dependent hydrolase